VTRIARAALTTVSHSRKSPIATNVTSAVQNKPPA